MFCMWRMAPRFDLLLAVLPPTSGPSDVPCNAPRNMAPGTTVTITRGPYLVVVNPTGATVKWRSSHVLSGSLRVGHVPEGYRWAGAGEGGIQWFPGTLPSTRCPGLDQEVVVTGLLPLHRYMYQVGAGMRMVVLLPPVARLTSAPLLIGGLLMAPWTYLYPCGSVSTRVMQKKVHMLPAMWRAFCIGSQVLWEGGTYADTEPGSATWGANAPQPFTTAPPFDTPAVVRVWAMGDMGTGQPEQVRVRDVALGLMQSEGRGADMVLALGGTLVTVRCVRVYVCVCVCV